MPLEQYETCEAPPMHQIFYSDPPELASLLARYDAYIEACNLKIDNSLLADVTACLEDLKIGGGDDLLDLEEVAVEEYGKRKMARITIEKFQHNFFTDFKGFTGTDKIPLGVAKSDYMYCVNSSILNPKIRNSEKFKVTTVNISGGIVVPNKHAAFHHHPAPDRDDGAVMSAHIVDFNSLYPTCMQFGNICQTAAAYNPSFAIRVKDQLVNPFNERVIISIGSPLKINDAYVYMTTFIIRPEVWVSAGSELIANVKALRVKMKAAQKACAVAGDHVGAARCEGAQKGYKLIINTKYGICLKVGYVSYRPELAALVTYFGRIALYRLFLSVYSWVKTQPRLLQAYRGVLGGDTDSLFIACCADEIQEIVKTFENWPSNRGVYKVEIEHVGLHSGVFLDKKNYIFYKANANKTPTVICKNTIKKSQTAPCKSLAERLIGTLLGGYFAGQTYDLCYQQLHATFSQFYEADDKYFRHQFRLRKDLSEYVGRNLIRDQLASLPGPYLAGADIRYAHYPFIFIEGPMYGPIQPSSRAQYKYSVSNPNSTALTEDMYELKYKKLFEESGISVNRLRALTVDLGSLLSKLFEATASIPVDYVQQSFSFLDVFSKAYKDVFNQEYFAHIRGKRAAGGPAIDEPKVLPKRPRAQKKQAQAAPVLSLFWTPKSTGEEDFIQEAIDAVCSMEH